MKCITNGKVILENEIVDANLYFENDTITEISDRVPQKEEVIDAGGLFVSPGFIDVHTHGRKGCDTMDADPDKLNTISKANLTTGCTAYLPTTMTMSIADVAAAVDAVAKLKGHEEGAAILGVHLEGPFISAKHKGAQAEENIIEPTIDNFKSLAHGHEELIRKITLAPERDCHDLVVYLAAKGISVSVGHSDATYEEALDAFAWGANSTTHTFNAMTPLKHRAPGIVGAAMNSPQVYSELILDGKHVMYPAAKILAAMKGKEKLVFITDSLEAAGMPVGQYELGGQKIWVKNGRAELADGTIAGSIAGLNEEVRHAVDHLNMSLNDAVNCASRNPADSIGESSRGRIKVGCKADLIFFDVNIDVQSAFVNGERKLGEE